MDFRRRGAAADGAERASMHISCIYIRSFPVFGGAVTVAAALNRPTGNRGVRTHLLDWFKHFYNFISYGLYILYSRIINIRTKLILNVNKIKNSENYHTFLINFRPISYANERKIWRKSDSATESTKLLCIYVSADNISKPSGRVKYGRGG